nr:hypothetical protein [Tanacetum cinerariifolium]
RYGRHLGHEQRGARPRPRGIRFLLGEGPARREPVEHGHADGDAIFDLVGNQAALVVHHGIAQLDPPVYGAGVHDVEAAVADFGQPGRGDAVDPVVLAHAGKELHILALHLHAEQVHYIGPPGHGRLVVGEARNTCRDVRGHQRARPEVRHLDAQLLEQRAGRARHARVQNVADDEDFFAPGVGKFLPDGKGVEQGLGGVLVRAVAGIDNRGRGLAGYHAGQAGVAVAHHDVVGTHGLEGLDGFAHRLAFGNGGVGNVEICDLRREAL